MKQGRILIVPTIPVSPIELATALGFVVIGSIIQGSIGFGLAAVVAPILLLVNKIFLPGPMLVTSMLLTSLIAWRDREHAVWSEVAVGTTGRIIGMMPAALAAVPIGSGLRIVVRRRGAGRRRHQFGRLACPPHAAKSVFH